MVTSSDDQVRVWDGLAVAVSLDRALLGPEAAALYVGLLDRIQRMDRVPLSPQAAHVRKVLRLVAAHAGSVSSSRASPRRSWRRQDARRDHC